MALGHKSIFKIFWNPRNGHGLFCHSLAIGAAIGVVIGVATGP